MRVPDLVRDILTTGPALRRRYARWRVHVHLLTVALFALSASSLSHAQEPLTSLACQPISGPAVLLNVYTVELQTTTSGFGDAYLVTSIYDINAATAAVSAGTIYPTCIFYTGGAPVVLSGATFIGAGAYGSGSFVPFNFFGNVLRSDDSSALLFSTTTLTYTGITSAGSAYTTNVPIGSMTCGSAGSVSVYSYTLEYNAGLAYLSMGVNLGAFSNLQAALAASKVYPSCALVTDLSVVFTNLKLEEVGVLGYGAGTYSTDRLLFASVDAAPEKVSVSGSPSYAPPLRHSRVRRRQLAK